MKKIAIVMLATLLLTACEFSLAGDVTPPPATEPVSAAPIEYPASEPDSIAGKAIYAVNCAPCHGADGLGDGEAATQLRFSPTALGDPYVSSLAKPVDWYATISSGRLESGMPPFNGLLTPQQRWDVFAHVLSLSLDESQTELGASLYAEHEAEILTVIPDLYEGEFVSSISRADLISLLREIDVAAEVGTEELEAIAFYIQANSFGLAQSAPVVGVPSTEETAVFGGRVVDGTDGEVPANLEAVIFGYDHDHQVFTATVPIDSAGEFTFNDVPLAAARIYFVSVDYAGLSYFSEFITPEADGTDFNIPITIYETTSDTSQLAAEVVQLVFEFAEPGVVRVVQRVEITNLGDRAVTPNADGVPVLHFGLPSEASDLQFQDGALGDRYVAVVGGFGDLRAVLPGESSYQNLFAYDLPYGQGLKLQAPIDLPTRSILALVPENEIKLSNPEFQLLGPQEIGGVTYSAYLGDGGYLPEDEVEISLSGPHPLGSRSLQNIVTDDRLVFGLTALTAAVGFAWLWLRRIAGERLPTADQIIDEIIALDESYERADIKQSTYEKRRAALKHLLRAVLEKSRK